MNVQNQIARIWIVLLLTIIWGSTLVFGKFHLLEMQVEWNKEDIDSNYSSDAYYSNRHLGDQIHELRMELINIQGELDRLKIQTGND